MDRFQKLIEQQGQWGRKHRGEHVAHHPDSEAEIRSRDRACDRAEIALNQRSVIEADGRRHAERHVDMAPARCASLLVASGVRSSGVPFMCSSLFMLAPAQDGSRSPAYAAA